MNTTSLQSLPSRQALQSRKERWTRYLGSLLATALIFISGSAFMSLIEAFH